jgi:2-oxoglutarate/2-oxoacid ferredoxin oxidoreductase subunit beta
VGITTSKNGNAPIKLTKKDFETDQDVRWCPGCGDYSILATVQKFLPSLNIPREKFVFISGIGCSSRFPYYMSTYGFHTIHGRAPAIATGVKVANPDLSVWLVTGDGDALSIGGNHFIHLLRRNLDINVLLFNNRIYGLTKGQYSPTSETGKVTYSTPYGSPDRPLNPILLALGAQSTFVARGLDVDAKLVTNILQKAVEHKGTSFIEIFQNCNIFNDNAFEYMSAREIRSDAQIILEDGKPLVFGKEMNKGLNITGLKPEIVHFNSSEPDAAVKAGVTTFDVTNPIMATILARLAPPPDFPVPMGVFYKQSGTVFEQTLIEQSEKAKAKSPPKDSSDETLSNLFNSAVTWKVG